MNALSVVGANPLAHDVREPRIRHLQEQVRRVLHRVGPLGVRRLPCVAMVRPRHVLDDDPSEAAAAGILLVSLAEFFAETCAIERPHGVDP